MSSWHQAQKEFPALLRCCSPRVLDAMHARCHSLLEQCHPYQERSPYWQPCMSRCTDLPLTLSWIGICINICSHSHSTKKVMTAYTKQLRFYRLIFKDKAESKECFGLFSAPGSTLAVNETEVTETWILTAVGFLNVKASEIYLSCHISKRLLLV